MRLPSIWSNNRSLRPFESGSLFDKFFQDLENEFFNTGLGRLGNTDIYEKNGNLNYEVEMPGLEKRDIKVQTRDDSLVVSGEIKEETETENKNYLSKGRRYGKFQRSFPLPEGIDDPADINAKFENGILHIEVPLKEPIEEKNVVDVEIE